MLLPLNTFAPIFAPYQGQRCLHVRSLGNAGDLLIWRATEQLLEKFQIEVQPVVWTDSPPTEEIREFDVCFFCGGGNMGRLYNTIHEARKNAAKLCRVRGKPFVILPQSWNSEDDVEYTMAYARESYSIEKFAPDAVLAPDLALAYEMKPWVEPEFPAIFAQVETGYFFRGDVESVHVPDANVGDPVWMAKNLKEYFQLAAGYRHIHTNRLHFAIVGLILRKRVTLYPNSYHKNLGVYEAWLRELPGIDFRETIPA